ncbi:MAG: holo-ACP synthase [Victivallaceae bacterium]
MIIGIGTDLAEIDRFRKLISRFNTSFTDRVFTSAEQQEAAMRNDPATYYAGRWAAKEALAKALGCGIGGSCALLEVEVCNQPTGQPRIELRDNALNTLRRLGGKHIHLSVSHEANYAVATVVIER